MASVADKSQQSDEPLDRGGNDLPARSAKKPPAPKDKEPGHGFFTIHKRGRGKWTRVGTAVAVGLLIAALAHFLHENLLQAVGLRGVVKLSVVVAVFVGLALLAFRMMNKPGNVDFLIATDDEMKKVNWATRKELIGSTRVVIFFMFAIAIFLFVMDIVFAFLFYLVGVLNKEFLPFQI